MFVLTFLEASRKTEARGLALFHLTQKSLRVAKGLHTKGVSLQTLKVNEHAAAAAQANDNSCDNTHRVESLAGKLGSDVLWGIRASKSTLIF